MFVCSLLPSLCLPLSVCLSLSPVRFRVVDGGMTLLIVEAGTKYGKGAPLLSLCPGKINPDVPQRMDDATYSKLLNASDRSGSKTLMN